jgi:hypothetical protein
MRRKQCLWTQLRSGAATAAGGFVVHSLGAVLDGRSVNGRVAGSCAGLLAGLWFDRWSALRVTWTGPATMACVRARMRRRRAVAGTGRAPHLEFL